MDVTCILSNDDKLSPNSYCNGDNIFKLKMYLYISGSKAHGDSTVCNFICLHRNNDSTKCAKVENKQLYNTYFRQEKIQNKSVT